MSEKNNRNQKTHAKTNSRRYKKRRFFGSQKDRGCSTPGSGESFSCGRFRFCAADLVRIAAGAVSVWSRVRHAVRPAPVNKTSRFFTAVLHGIKKRSDHPDFRPAI